MFEEIYGMNRNKLHRFISGISMMLCFTLVLGSASIVSFAGEDIPAISQGAIEEGTITDESPKSEDDSSKNIQEPNEQPKKQDPKKAPVIKPNPDNNSRPNNPHHHPHKPGHKPGDRIKSWEIQFDPQGGTPTPEAISVSYGALIPEPETVTKAGHKFIGWSLSTTDPALLWDFENDTISYKSYKKNPFDNQDTTNNPNIINNQNIISNQNIINPGIQYKHGLKHKHPPKYPKELTLYALWQKDVYTITFYGSGGTIGGSQTTKRAVEFNSTIGALSTDEPTEGGTPTDGAVSEGGITGGGISEGGITNGSVNEGGMPSEPGDTPNDDPINTPIDDPVNGSSDRGGNGDPDSDLPDDTSTNGAVTDDAISAKGMVYPDNRQGYDFGGWYISGTSIAFDPNEPVVSDMDIVAKWNPQEFSITYMYNYDKKGIYCVTTGVTCENRLKKPSDPHRDGYIFGGWYANSECTEKYDFSVPVFEDTVIYAKWNSYSYTVTYNSGKGAFKSKSNVVYKTVASPDKNVKKLPVQPSRTGYIFNGWYSNKNGQGKAFTATTPVTEDISVYAAWCKKYYQLSFDLNGTGGKTPATQSVQYNELGKKVSNPVRHGYDFLSWNTKADGSGASWSFAKDKMPANNIKLYAQWMPVTATEVITTATQKTFNYVKTKTTTTTDDSDVGMANRVGGSESVISRSVSAVAVVNVVKNIIDSGMVAELASTDLQNVSIVDSEVPMLGSGGLDSWALINLILSIAGMLIALVTLMKLLIRRRYRENTYMEDYSGYEYEVKRKVKSYRRWLVLTIAAGICGVILFLLTQDLSKLMVLADKWTIASALFFIVGIVGMVLTFKIADEADTDELVEYDEMK